MNIKECQVISDQSQRRISYVHLCKNTNKKYEYSTCRKGGGGEVGLCRGQSIDVIRNFFRPAVRINNSIVYTIGVSVIPSAFNV